MKRVTIAFAMILLFSVALLAYDFDIDVYFNVSGASGEIWLEDNQGNIISNGGFKTTISLSSPSPNGFTLSANQYMGVYACVSASRGTEHDSDKALASHLSTTNLYLDLDGKEPDDPPGGH